MADTDKDLPPLPWTWQDLGPADGPLGHGFVYLLDANGRKIGTFWGRPHEKIATANMVVGAADAMKVLRQIHVDRDIGENAETILRRYEDEIKRLVGGSSA